VNHVAAFVGISLVVICTPGPDTALIVRNALLGGRSNGVRTAAGIVTGLTVWTLAASAGVAAIVAASHPLFTALRFGGAAYLVWLGLQTLRGHRGFGVPHGGSGYRQGVLSNLGNPKVAVFFTSLLPQFAGRDASFVTPLALGVAFAAMTLAWLSAYAVVVAKAGDFLRRPRIRRTIEGLTGAVLLGLGGRLAAERG
jgi:threonine/homoserine/homoserine lactone efflux protein